MVDSNGLCKEMNLVIRSVYLLMYSNTSFDSLEDLIWIEGCIVSGKEKNLYILYSCSYDPRVTLMFNTEAARIEFESRLCIAGNIRRFKDFYTLENRINRGKYANIHLCREDSTGKRWVAKFIRKRVMKDAAREMARNEISILRSLDSPFIVKFKDSFESRKYTIIVMEYVEGGELFKKIKSERIAEAEAKTIIRRILSALSYMHRLGIIHRDLKPENVLFTGELYGPSIKIIDFGLAIYSVPKVENSMKFGSARYSAPEAFSGKYTNKVDMWSLGLIAYALVSGKLLETQIKGECRQESTVEIVEFQESIWKFYSEELKDFIRKLLNVCPEERLSAQSALSHPWIC